MFFFFNYFFAFSWITFFCRFQEFNHLNFDFDWHKFFSRVLSMDHKFFSWVLSMDHRFFSRVLSMDHRVFSRVLSMGHVSLNCIFCIFNNNLFFYYFEAILKTVYCKKKQFIEIIILRQNMIKILFFAFNLWLETIHYFSII